MRVLVLILCAMLPGCQTIVGIEDPAGAECETLGATSECGESQVCDYDSDLGRPTCRAIGTTAYGETCDEQTDCAVGLSCTETVCRTLCSDDQQCTQSDEAECKWSKGEAKVCDNSCDVLTTASCPGGFECEITYNSDGVLTSACVPDYWFGDVEMGGGCQDLTNCVEGLACIDVDSDGEGVCMPLCVIGSSDCPASAVCDFEIGDLHGVEMGICRP